MPTKKNICKIDLDAAFCRGTLSSSTASKCLTIFDNMPLMALRMTFGGAPCPFLWGIILESLADIANMLIHKYPLAPFETLWQTTTYPRSPIHSIWIHPLSSRQRTSSFDASNNLGQVDLYIDDTIGITPNLQDNACRVSRAILLAIHTLARPICNKDIISWNDIISLKKYKAGGWMDKKSGTQMDSQYKIVFSLQCWMWNGRIFNCGIIVYQNICWSIKGYTQHV